VKDFKLIYSNKAVNLSYRVLLGFFIQCLKKEGKNRTVSELLWIICSLHCFWSYFMHVRRHVSECIHMH